MSRKSLQLEIKLSAMLMFLQLILAINWIAKPFFVFLGIFLIAGTWAYAWAGLVILLILGTIYLNLRLYRFTVKASTWFYSCYAINSAMALASSFVIVDDYTGFLEDAFGQGILPAFRIYLAFSIILSFAAIAVVRRSTRNYVY